MTNPLRTAFETLVAGRDRFAAAVAALAPLLEAGLLGEPVEVEPEAPPVKALPAGRKKGAKARAPIARAKPAAKATGLRPRVSPETIARIQQLDGQGKPRSEIAKLCGVSAPTVTKYADMPPVKSNGTGPKPAPAARTDPRTGRPWV